VNYTISNLRDVRQYQHIVANRIWEAWWKQEGHSAESVAVGLAEIVAATDFPFALVAHQNGEYLGHILGIASDLSSRPDLSPWLAALWVDPTHRRKSVALKLLNAAQEQLSKIGHSKIYLCAIEEKRSYYSMRGWVLIDHEEKLPALDIFEKNLG